MGAPDSLWLSGSFVTHVDVLVERPSGSGTVLQSLRNFGGHNWLRSGRLEPSDADTPIGSGSVSLHRQIDGVSLAPLLTGSALNQDGGEYAPALDFAREIEVRACNLPNGTEPVSGDWETIFQGITDDPEWGGKNGNITLPFRDRSGPLADTFIREKITYGSEDGVDAVEVAQAILDRWMGEEQYVVQDLVAGARYMVTDYTPMDVSVFEALQSLALSWGGKALRQWPDGTGEFRITYMEPDRTKTVADYAIGPSLYLDIPTLSTGGAGFRNIVKGQTTDSTGRVLTSQIPAEEDVATDPLVLKYGERALTFTEDGAKGVDTQAELDAMTAAGYSDVSALTFPMDTETRFAPFARLDDMVAWGANEVLFDNDQPGAVIGLQHTFDERGRVRTRWKLGARPVASISAWLQRSTIIRGLNAAPVETLYSLYNVRFDETLETATHFAVVWENGGGVDQNWGAVRIYEGQENRTRWEEVAASVTRVTQPLMVPKPGETQVTLVRLEGRYEDGGVWRSGPAKELPIYPQPAEQPVADVDWTETPGSATVWWKEQERGVAVVAREVWRKVGADQVFGPDAPTRGPGGTSAVLAGNPVLGTGQYEYDFNKDPNRNVSITAFLSLLTTEVQAIVFPTFDPDTQPTLGRVDVVEVAGQIIIRVYGADSDTRSLKVETAGLAPGDTGYFAFAVDGTYYDFVVPDPGGTRQTYNVWAFATPKDAVAVDTPSDVAQVVVSGTTYTPGTEPSWTVHTAEAPPLGDETITLNLQASAAPAGYYAQVKVRTRTSGTWGAFTDITSSLSPALSAPPTTETAYVWNSGVVKTGYSPVAYFQFQANIYNASDELKGTVTETLNYLYGLLPGGPL